MKSVRILCSFAIVVAFSFSAWTEGLPTAKPEEVGLSSDRLERIGTVMEQHVESGAISGAMGMIARHGKLVYTETWGYADRETKAPMEADKIFRIYSMSKPITSTALMSLYEEGKFLLDEPVSKYIPELGGLEVMVEDDDNPQVGGVFNLPDEEDLDNTSEEAANEAAAGMKTVPSVRDMTIHDLFRHTAGLTYGFFGNSPIDKMYMRSGILTTDKDLADLVSKLSKIPLRYEPGTKWHYSVAVDVQGRLIEVLSGMPFDEFLEERIFGPLNMTDTGFYVPKEKMDRFAQMYTPDNANGGIKVAPAFYSMNFVKKPTLNSGGGGMVSTAADYLRFCQMLLNGGILDGQRILSRKTVELMRTDHLGEIPFRAGAGFGLGFAVVQKPGLTGAVGSPGEYSWGGAAGTRFWIDPVEELIGVYMIQILPHTDLTYGTVFKNLTYQAVAD